MKIRCWQASKGLRLSMSAELTGYDSIISTHQGLTGGMETHRDHLDGKQHPRSVGFPKPGRDAEMPCSLLLPPRGSRISICSRVIIIVTFSASSSSHTRLLTVLENGNLYLLSTLFLTYFVLFLLSLFLLPPFIAFFPQLCNCINI